MERLTLTHIKIKFQNTKSQKLPDRKSDIVLSQNLKMDIGLSKWEGFKPFRIDLKKKKDIYQWKTSKNTVTTHSVIWPKNGFEDLENRNEPKYTQKFGIQWIW